MMNIELQNLSFLPSGKEIFKDINFSFKAGFTYLISGPSGCGKSSLMDIISGLKPQSAGTLLSDGKIPVNMCDYRKSCQYLRQVAFVYPKTVKENLLSPLQYHNMNTHNDEELDQLSSKLFPEGLDLKQDATELSGGQQQRLALLRAFLLKPKVLICDELSAGLDEISRELCENFLENECAELTLIYVTHIKDSFGESDKTIRLKMNKNSLELM